MLVTPITNYLQQTQALLMQQYKGPTRFNAVLAALVAQVQELETVLFDVNSGRTVFGSIGEQLDELGSLFNVFRNGLTDDEYRLFILGAIAEDNSDTTIPTILNVVLLLFRPQRALIFETFPAEIEVDLYVIGLQENLWPLVYPMIQASLGGGIKLGSVVTGDLDTPFRFSDANTGAVIPGTSLGFSDALNPGAGGGLLGDVIYNNVGS